MRRFCNWGGFPGENGSKLTQEVMVNGSTGRNQMGKEKRRMGRREIDGREREREKGVGVGGRASERASSNAKQRRATQRAKQRGEGS